MSKWGEQYAHKTDAFSATPVWQADAMKAISLIDGQPLRVLDFGCGTGRLLEYLAETLPNAALFGVDVNVAGFAIAQERCPKAKMYETVKPFVNIDLCIIMHALPQFSDPHAELSRLWTAMRPGGQLIVITHNDWFSRVRKPLDLINGYKPDPTITTNFTKGTLDQLMRDQGFLKTESAYYGGKPSVLPMPKPRLYFNGRRPK